MSGSPSFYAAPVDLGQLFDLFGGTLPAKEAPEVVLEWLSRRLVVDVAVLAAGLYTRK
jgi:hypothetical protein